MTEHRYSHSLMVDGKELFICRCGARFTSKRMLEWHRLLPGS